ncbi:MAG TPA: DMT family transporter [Gammaproteobacteria bacterium]|nr:DMT family transporter [Gammaproteobacteria bacterium]
MPTKTYMAILLAILVLIWGISWPIMTEGLKYCPPIWFSTLRLIIAVSVVFAVFGALGQLSLPSKRDLPLIFSIGFFQIGVFEMLITLGLGYVEPGRSAIIAYLAPFFVTPVAVMFFGEELSLGKIAGLLLGGAGIALLFSPWQLNWHDKHILLGNGLLVLSSVVWGAVMLHTRYATWHRATHVLLPWQLLMSVIPNLVMAFILVPHMVIEWHAPMFLFSLLYNALLSSLVAYWLVITITRHLPVITMSLALLAVPVLGLLASAATLGEQLTPSIIMSLVLIVVGLACVSVAKD